MPEALELFRIPVVGIEGNPATLEPYRGKVLLIVNVASACGFTPQYQGLEVLWRKYRDRGFAVLGFPCNQFGGQEPGTESDILCFTKERYSVGFPLFAKIEVNGAHQHPLYRYLKRSAKGLLGTESIKWNFTKFLSNRDGDIVARFGPATTPSTIEARIEGLLG
jgi:glutathione peroxidase